MKNHPIYDKAARGEYITHADLAKLIRTALKTAFSKTKFSVTSKSYSGGSSVSVHWTDGPTSKQVDRVVCQFETRDFDGSIDMAHSCSLWLYPDGAAHCAHDAGTAGSRGSVDEHIESPRNGTAILCENVAHSYVQTSRHYSVALYQAAIDAVKAHNWVDLDGFDWSAVSIDTSYYGPGIICPSVQVNGDYLQWEINREASKIDMEAVAA